MIRWARYPPSARNATDRYHGSLAARDGINGKPTTGIESMDVSYFAIASAFIGGIVWLVRLEGRVNTNEALHQALREDLTYIRDRIDSALNGHGK